MCLLASPYLPAPLVRPHVNTLEWWAGLLHSVIKERFTKILVKDAISKKGTLHEHLDAFLRAIIKQIARCLSELV
jgi:hypothetical protein